MFVSNNKTVAVLDIGSSKIVTLIANVSEDEFEIIGSGNHAAEGIRNGVVSDVKLARASIASSVYEAEKLSGKNIDRVVVNVSNPLLRSRTITIKTNFGGNQILPSDIQKLKSIVLNKIDLAKNEVLSYKVLKYDLDEMKDISDPEFMFANLLTAYAHVMTVPLKYLVNMGSCLLGCQLKIKSFVPSSRASAEACLTEEEKKEGCVLIDIGAGCSDYVAYKNKQIVGCGVIPIGGSNITRDIAEYFSTSFDDAEKIKLLHGGLKRIPSEESKIIESKSSKKINNQTLNRVIIARFSETMDFVMERLKEKKQNRTCLNRVVFTGGCSKLSGMLEFVTDKYRLNARIGVPNAVSIENGFSEDPSFATAVGLLKSSSGKATKTFRHNHSKVKRVLLWLKQNF